jgi:hypothetical protein
MKTLEQIKSSYKSNTLDGRDLNRLIAFVPFNMLPFCGIKANEGVTEEQWNEDLKPLTRENIIEQLKSDVEFGFEKALNKRGLSAGMMASVISMWNWILEEGLEDLGDDDYAEYGLPIFKATALKYGFDNPIGDDTGSEYKYSSESDD